MADARTGTRWKALAVLVALVVAVDAAAIAIFFLADIRRASPAIQLVFAVAWTLVTVVVVMRGMRALLRR